MKIKLRLSAAVCLLFGGVTLSYSQDSPAQDTHIRATLGGSSDGQLDSSSGWPKARISKNKLTPYSPHRNILEVEFGGHTEPAPSDNVGWYNTPRYKSLNYLGISYLHKFTPNFGLGIGYERFTTNSVYSYSDSYSSYTDKITSLIDAYKLLLRFAFIPDKSLNPELTIGLGGFTEQDKSTWLDSYYDSYYGTWTNYSDVGEYHSHGLTGSVGIGLRYHITKRFSVGVDGKIAYFKVLNGYSSWWHWYQYGVFTGVGF